MAAAVRIRYVYETSFFDGRPGSSNGQQPESATDQVDSAINHPIVRRIQQAVIRARKAVTSGSSSRNIDMMALSDDDDVATAASLHHHDPSSIMSSLQTSMCSLDGEELLGDDGRLVSLNRSRSLQQTHLLHEQQHHRGFSLHLSPKQRTRIGEAVLSPISDKSENETSQMLNTGAAAQPVTEFNPAASSSSCISRRRPQSLFPNIISRPGGFNSSDSGISISANSLVNSSHEALQQTHKPTTHLSLNNSQEFLSSSSSEPPEESLPFLMPKLRRGGAAAAAGFNCAGIFQPQAPSGPVRQLSLTLPFPQSLPFVAPAAVGFKDLVDDTIPLDVQNWYHGSITRRDAEKRLRPAPAGSFLVRDSMASHDDYFLAARGENGFLHVRIVANLSEDDPSIVKDFTLATLPDRRFESVAAAVNHCANIGVYCRQLPPVVLKYPLAEEPV